MKKKRKFLILHVGIWTDRMFVVVLYEYEIKNINKEEEYWDKKKTQHNIIN